MDFKKILIVAGVGLGALLLLGGQKESESGLPMGVSSPDTAYDAPPLDLGNLFGGSNQQLPYGFFDSRLDTDKLTKKEQATPLFREAGFLGGQQAFAPTSSDASLYANLPIVKGGAPLQVVSPSTTRFTQGASGVIPYSVQPEGMTKKQNASSQGGVYNVPFKSTPPTQQNILQGLKKL